MGNSLRIRAGLLATALALGAGGLVVVDPMLLPAAAEATTSRLLVTSFGGSISAIDPGLGSVVAGPVSLGGSSAPYAVAVTPNGTSAFVPGFESNNVTPITVATLAPRTNLCLPSGNCPSAVNTAPSAVAVTPDGSIAYVVNSGNDTVSAVIVAQSKVANTPIQLPGGSRPAGIAITPDGATAFVTAYATGYVYPISLPGGVVGSPIAVGPGPQGIAVTPDGRNVIVANTGGAGRGSVSRLDLSVSPVAVLTFDPEPTQSNPTAPTAVAISPSGTMAYVTDTRTNRVVPITIATAAPGSAKVVGQYPASVTVHPDGTKAYVGNLVGNSVSVVGISGATVTVTGTIATPAPTGLAFVPDQAPTASFTNSSAPVGSPVSFDASSSHSNPSGGALTYRWDWGDGTTTGPMSSSSAMHTFPSPGDYSVSLAVTSAAGTSTTQVFTGQTVSRNGGPGARATRVVAQRLAINGAAPIALATSRGGAVVTPLGLTPATPAAASGPEIGVGDAPAAVAITPDGQTAYVADRGSNTVTPIDLADGEALLPIPVGSTPSALAITPDGSAAYVVNSGDNSVQRITTATGAVGPPISVGHAPSAIAIRPDGAVAYVTNGADNTVTPIDLGTDLAGGPTTSTGMRNPVAIAVAPSGTLAYVLSAGTATTRGALTVLNLAGSAPVVGSTINVGAVGAAPSAIAISPNGGVAYVTTSTGLVIRLTLSTASAAVTLTVTAARSLTGIAITPDATAAYVTGMVNTPSGPASAVVPLKITSGIAVGAAAPVAADPSAIAITPDQAPIAHLNITPTSAGVAPLTVAFDAGGSSNPSSPIASYAWRFGDGATATTTGPTTSHTYTVAGGYIADVTLTDAAGTSTALVFTGQTVSRRGSATARATRLVVVTPKVTSVTPANGAAGATITVNGAGFSTVAGATTVDVGLGHHATNVVCSTTIKCTAKVPAGSGSQTVRAIVSTQVSAENPAATFTYGSSPPTTVPSPTTTKPCNWLCQLLGGG